MGLCLFIKVVKLLFIMIMDVLTKDVWDGSLMELLYVDNLLLCGRLRGAEHFMTSMVCRVRLVYWVSTCIIWNRVGVVEKIEDIMQSCLQWYDDVIH